MRIETNAANRKDVVKAVSGILGQPSKYLGVPTCAYQIGNCTIDRSGAVETEDEKTAEMVRAGLLEQGLIESLQAEVEETTVSLPVEGMTAEGLKNLIFLTRSKQYLINRAFAEDVFRVPTALVEELGSTEIPDAETFLQTFQNHAEGCRGIGFQDGKITFTLPTADDPDMIKAFTHLTAAMVQQAKEQKRISPKETIEENEKYYMRIWLLRLGFGGKEGKEVRDLLMKKLKGHSAFRTEENKQRWQEARRNEREAAKQEQSPAEEPAGQPEAEPEPAEAVPAGQDSGAEE
ncbi:hypothetical protein [Eisenbergiella tayi]|jgi:hypothetical protein|uniref:hypothetical protein n=1 Tax=Eisenbergiella tayi TaxID=1432052 RepID=UPI0024312824|nr:hypothetical protein [Eisenbergiella tayi]